MGVYWLSFRLAEEGDYDLRYKGLYAAIESRSTKWWFETSSFILFESAESIGTLSTAVKAAIDPSKDLVVLGMTEIKDMRVIGVYEDRDIESLVPFMKKV